MRNNRKRRCLLLASSWPPPPKAYPFGILFTVPVTNDKKGSKGTTPLRGLGAAPPNKHPASKIKKERLAPLFTLRFIATSNTIPKDVQKQRRALAAAARLPLALFGFHF